MIIALAGSPRSSSGPARNSRERLRASASDSLSAVASAVVIPHPVFVLMAALTGSLSLAPGPLTPGSPALSSPAGGMSPAGSGSSRRPAPRDDPPAVGGTLADGRTPSGGQTPAAGETPSGGQTPAAGETPSGGQTPAADAPASPAVLVYVPPASATE